MFARTPTTGTLEVSARLTCAQALAARRVMRSRRRINGTNLRKSIASPEISLTRYHIGLPFRTGRAAGYKPKLARLDEAGRLAMGSGRSGNAPEHTGGAFILRRPRLRIKRGQTNPRRADPAG